MELEHIVCYYCGVLLECDNLDISLDEYDYCEDTGEYHRQKWIKCTCLPSVKN